MDPKQRTDKLVEASENLDQAKINIEKASDPSLEANLCLESAIAAHTALLEALARVASVVTLLTREERRGQIGGVPYDFETQAIQDGLPTRSVNSLRRIANIANGVYEPFRVGEMAIAEKGPILKLKDFGRISYSMIGDVRNVGFTTLVDLRNYFESKGLKLEE